MKSIPSTSSSDRVYHTGYIVVLLLLFLSVGFMGVRQGSANLEDNFYQKNLLIENFNRIRLKLGDRVFNNVLVGKNGWMEFTADHNLDDYQNVQPLSRKALKNMGRNIQSCYQYAQEQGITFLIVVPPNKASIYPDKLPDQIRPLSEQSRLDQLNEYLEGQGIPKVLDLRPALREARQRQDVYYQMGTHWNETGAYVAYAEIIKALAVDHPELVPYPDKFLRFREDTESANSRGDKEIARMIQANYLSLEPNLFATRNVLEIVNRINLPGTTIGYHRITWIPNSDLPTLMMFHDSFGVAGLNSFLSLNFSKVSYIFRQASADFLNRKTIDMFAPDVVIYEVVERNLNVMEENLAGCAAE
jgi:hypothetical protein